MPEAITRRSVEEAIGPLTKFTHQCHAASLALVRSGLLPGEGWRVARGWARGVGSQHSWAVRGDPYARRSAIVDITMWSYQSGTPKVWQPANLTAHEPHGYGWLIPDVIEDPSKPLADLPMEEFSPELRSWIEARYPNGIGMLDLSRLTNGPMLAWPSRELIRAVSGDKKLAGFIPIDIRGMLTDDNPGKLYW